jgi:uncharacterized protein (TIGR03067 family)
MILRLASVLALIIAAQSLAGDGKRERFDVEESDGVRVQGRWKAEKRVHNGMEIPVGPNENLRIEFKGTKAIPEHEGRKEKEAEFKIGVGKSPRTIDIITPEGIMIAGIFQINGDTMKLCFSAPGDSARPTKFESPNGSNIMLIIMRRDRK